MPEKMTSAEFRDQLASNRKKGGKKAKKNGEDSEGLILRICNRYRVTGRATLEKVDPPTKVVNFGGKAKVIFQKNPFLDIVGAWTERGGRACFFEVKSTEKHRLPISRDNGLTEAQIESLRQWRAAGAVTGVLWIHKGRLKVLTLETVEAVEEMGNPSIQWSDFRLCHSGSDPLIPFDFLEELASL